MGRLISDILTESGLIDTLRAAGSIQDLTTINGSTLDAHTLRRMQLIGKVTSTPTVIPDILTRRNPVVDFPLIFKEELSESVQLYLESCVRDQSEVDPSWIRGRNPPSLDELIKRDKKKKEKKKKRKVTGEGPAAKKAKKQKKPSGIVISDSVPVNSSEQVSTESLKIPRTSEQFQKLIEEIGNVDTSSLHSSSDLPPQQKPPSSEIPSSSTTTKRKRPLHSEPIINPKPLNVFFPPIPSKNIFSTNQPTSSIPKPISPIADPSSPSTFSDPIVVVLDSDNEVESFLQPSSSNTSFLFDRVSEPYSIFQPESPITRLRTNPPKPSVDIRFELLKYKAEFLDLQKDCLAAAPGPAGLALEYVAGINSHPISDWKPLEEAPFVDEMEVDNPLPLIEYPPKEDPAEEEQQVTEEQQGEAIPVEEEPIADNQMIPASDVPTSSVGPSTSVLMETLKELQVNQSSVFTRLDKQDETNEEFKSWMQRTEESSKKQAEDTAEIKNLLVALASKSSQS
ncbi:uncharacterized protein LOC131613744 [Vicia villosa]|uniref:uncharacterized protein LOC131613744 n=1 Tax=Vicia villosa TaxID=3911 RepID=UPI00273C428F|nr:uncharacterized protein LOC131613744 [Vicia villosa]